MDKDYVRLVISDLHLGSLYAKEERIYELLKQTTFDELILAGDIIDFIKVPTFTERSGLLFKFVMKLKKPIIYIVGNHDVGFRRLIGQKVGNISFVEQHDFEYRGRKYRIQHGDQYETGVVHWRFFMRFVSILQDFFERRLKFNLASWWVSLFKKKNQLKRIWDIVKNWNDDADVFIMGHTHHPEAIVWVDKNENIKTYVNTGDWVDNETYVIIKDGQVRLKNFIKDT